MYRAEMPKKGGLWQFVDLGGGGVLGEKERWGVFEGGWYLIAHYETLCLVA